MLSKMPNELSKLSKEDLDREILRVGIIAELDAINLYEQLASITENQDIKKVLLDIAEEEKVHFGEFQELLLRIDHQQVDGIEKGKKEVKDLVG
ncbi:MAG: hypothetical protein G5Z42_01990 [Caldisphaeraceae archaeon]|nr:hypothetical protein [Caldisphaeraceae archaeon]MEB3692426.1 hypothetical protein [Caldisphaeraceae archaeon]MEB3797577.1 hypothetical protein [Caldisphaeraceae archaeon]